MGHLAASSAGGNRLDLLRDGRAQVKGWRIEQLIAKGAPEEDVQVPVAIVEGMTHAGCKLGKAVAYKPSVIIVGFVCCNDLSLFIIHLQDTVAIDAG